MSAPFRYDGKRAVVTGAHSGMGAATAALLAELGAEVVAVDVKPVTGPVAKYVETDLGDPASIRAALDAIGEPVDCLFNCAGVPQTFPAVQVMKVNFLGLRELTEGLLPRIPDGGAVASVSSIAGNGWQAHLERIQDLLATPDFAAGLAWCESHADDLGDGYFFSKECVTVYTMQRAKTAVQAGVRINSIAPGPVETPMMPAFRQVLGSKMLDWTASQANGRMGRAEEMAPPLVFLNSTEASYVNGVNLIVDAGFTAASTTGQVDLGALRG